MGNSYSKTVTQWSKGEYANANNTQDDLQKITSSNGFGYRIDDHGDTAATASVLDVSSGSVSASGIIEKNTDVDVFTISTGGGDLDISLTPYLRSPNLDILAELYDASQNLVFQSNPVSLLSSTITAFVAAGDYFLHISGVGKGDPLTTGYSDYGSLGQYWIDGNFVPVVSANTLAIAATDADRTEGDIGSTDFLFTVTRTGDTSESSTVNYAVTGSGTIAADGADFVGGALPTGVVSFGIGEASQVIAVPLAGDTDVEGDEGFTVTLSSASGAWSIGVATADGIVRNDDGNDPPVAGDDAFIVDEDSPAVSLDVMANDSTAPDIGETLTITGVTTASAGGSVTVVAGTSISYQPAANFFGNETFTYTINDGTPGSDATATVTITVTPLNDAPTAVDNTFTVDEDSPAVSLDVMANDSTAHRCGRDADDHRCDDRVGWRQRRGGRGHEYQLPAGRELFRQRDFYLHDQ